MSKRYDKPIPYGWYAVEYSNQLKDGDVKPLKYFGRELVLFRTESGEASLLDAYCPHLGAHLGHGGQVTGGGISCPFHAWRFDGSGTCVEIPYANRVPPKVDGKPSIRSYPLVERNQMIWAWYHPQDAEPLFEVEDISELSSDKWTALESYDWVINSIIQETGENAADIAHFVTVHGAAAMPEGEVVMDGPFRRTRICNDIHQIDENGVVDRSGDNLDTIALDSASIGPGQTIQRISRLFEIILMGTVTPIDDQSLHLRFNFTLPKQLTDEHLLYAHGFRDEVVHQLEQDLPIWEHKIYMAEPTLCDGDGPIAKYRKWFQQFYAE